MAIAATAFSAAAALARRALPEHAPHGKRGKRDHDGQDDYRRRIHFSAFLSGRTIAQMQNASARSATAVQKPNPPPAKRTPS